MIDLRLPKIDDKLPTDKKLEQLQSYLYQLVQSLNWALNIEDSKQITTSEVSGIQTIVDDMEGLSSKVSQNAKEISAEVTRASEVEGTLSGRISLTSDQILAEVTRATDAEDSLSSRLRVAEGEVSASVKQGTSYNGFKITTSGCTIEGDGAFVVNMNNFKLNSDGSVVFGKEEGHQVFIDQWGHLVVGGYATTDQLSNVRGEIPTYTSELINNSGYKNEAGVVSIINGTVTADYVNALEITAAHIKAGGITASEISGLNYIRSDSAMSSISCGNSGNIDMVCNGNISLGYHCAVDPNGNLDADGTISCSGFMFGGEVVSSKIVNIDGEYVDILYIPRAG